MTQADMRVTSHIGVFIKSEKAAYAFLLPVYVQSSPDISLAGLGSSPFL